jgi:hypothetical protein
LELLLKLLQEELLPFKLELELLLLVHHVELGGFLMNFFLKVSHDIVFLARRSDDVCTLSLIVFELASVLRKQGSRD